MTHFYFFQKDTLFVLREDDSIWRHNMDYEKKMEAMEQLKKADENNIECPACRNGRFMGIFFFSCTNYECDLYDVFAMGTCHICQRPRIQCTC